MFKGQFQAGLVVRVGGERNTYSILIKKPRERHHVEDTDLGKVKVKVNGSLYCPEAQGTVEVQLHPFFCLGARIGWGGRTILICTLNREGDIPLIGFI